MEARALPCWARRVRQETRPQRRAVSGKEVHCTPTASLPSQAAQGSIVYLLTGMSAAPPRLKQKQLPEAEKNNRSQPDQLLIAAAYFHSSENLQCLTVAAIIADL